MEKYSLIIKNIFQIAYCDNIKNISDEILWLKPNSAICIDPIDAEFVVIFYYHNNWCIYNVRTNCPSVHTNSLFDRLCKKYIYCGFVKDNETRIVSNTCDGIFHYDANVNLSIDNVDNYFDTIMPSGNGFLHINSTDINDFILYLFFSSHDKFGIKSLLKNIPDNIIFHMIDHFNIISDTNPLNEYKIIFSHVKKTNMTYYHKKYQSFTKNIQNIHDNLQSKNNRETIDVIIDDFIKSLKVDFITEHIYVYKYWKLYDCEFMTFNELYPDHPYLKFHEYLCKNENATFSAINDYLSMRDVYKNDIY